MPSLAVVILAAGQGLRMNSRKQKILHEVGVRHIVLRSAGHNHVDISKCKELGISVANVPQYSPYAVAEHTIALMMALNRKLTRANNRVKELNFSLDGLMGFDMNGKTKTKIINTKVQKFS